MKCFYKKVYLHVIVTMLKFSSAVIVTLALIIFKPNNFLFSTFSLKTSWTLVLVTTKILCWCWSSLTWNRIIRSVGLTASALPINPQPQKYIFWSYSRSLLFPQFGQHIGWGSSIVKDLIVTSCCCEDVITIALWKDYSFICKKINHKILIPSPSCICLVCDMIYQLFRFPPF